MVRAERAAQLVDLRPHGLEELRHAPALEIRSESLLPEDPVDRLREERLRVGRLEHAAELGDQLVQPVLEHVERLAIDLSVEMVDPADHEREPPAPVAEVERAQELPLLVARVAGRLQQAGASAQARSDCRTKSACVDVGG